MKIKQVTIKLPAIQSESNSPGAFVNLSDSLASLSRHLLGCSKLIVDLNTNPPQQHGDTFASMQVFIPGPELIKVSHQKNRRVFTCGCITITEED